MSDCLIALGSNLGDRRAHLDRAAAALANHAEIRLTAQSGWIETAAAGGPGRQAPFLNGAVRLQTALPPQALLAVLQEIEHAQGRRRTQRWQTRCIDLDLLLYDQLELHTPDLTLPHPRMAWRRFALQPAAQIAASMVHPATGWTIGRLLRHLDTTAPYLAISGSIGAGKTQLAERLARRDNLRLVREQLDASRLTAFYADPSGQAWTTELEFLRQRARLLGRDATAWTAEGWTLSDFWFDQSPAFARVWLPPARYGAYCQRWRALREEVARPRLIAVLEVDGEELRRRVVQRGRAFEQGLSPQQLEAIGRSIDEQTKVTDQGPVLRLDGRDARRALEEVEAALVAME